MIKITPKLRDYIETLRILDTSEEHINILFKEIEKDIFVSYLDIDYIMRYLISQSDINILIEEISNRNNIMIIDFIKGKIQNEL